MSLRPALTAMIGLLLASPLHAQTTAPGCSLPESVHNRRFTNVSDPLYRPDNPNAGRMVRVDFAEKRYLLSVLGSRLRFQGDYRYTRLAPNVAVVDLHEAFEGGDSRYQLLLTCLTDYDGQFVYTQFEGPIAPRRRQNSGRWTLQPR